MSYLEHQLIQYSDNSGYDNSTDPSTKNSFSSGESVVICRAKNSLISLRSLTANDYQCPFCLNKLDFDLAIIGVADIDGKGIKKSSSNTDSQSRYFGISSVLWGGFAGVMMLCLVVTAIGLFVTLGGSGSISNPSLIYTPTPSQMPKPSIIPTLTIETIQTLIPQPGKTPQPTSISLTLDPEEFARWYFTAVWEDRNYKYLWDGYLTTSFKNHSSPGGFKDYTDWWGSVGQIDIHSIEVIQNDGSNAWIRIKVTFHLVDGRILSNRQYDYDLIYNSDLNTWMFDYHN